MKNNKNNDELKDNNQKNVSSNVQINKKETGKISQAKSIIFLPFDLNVSNPEIKEPYTRIRSDDSAGKRNKLSDILKEPNEKVECFEEAIKKDNFKSADSIIDTSKYLDFIANNLNYKKNLDANIGFLDWYEKDSDNKKYILPKNESGQKNIFEPKAEFKIEKFGIILNKSARSGSIFIEITWTGEENKLDLLSEIDFFRYHDEKKSNKIKEIKIIKRDFNNELLKEISSFITINKPKEINPDSVELSGVVNLNETEIAEMGFCLSKNNHPTISDKVINPINNRLPKNILKKVVGNLDQNTTYYYRAYFIDITGKISYGCVQSFTTSSCHEENKETTISKILSENYGDLYNLIYFNHVKPTLVHLIRDSNAFGRDNDELSKLIYKTLRIPANVNNDVNKRREIKFSDIVNLQSPDENISFATMNEGVLIIDNTIDLNALPKKYLPAFVLALNQREFLLKVIRLAPYVDLKNLQELKDLKKFVTEVYLKQISFTVSIYNEIDLLFSELQKKFNIETLMKDNKESINEIHQLIESKDKDQEERNEKIKDAEEKVNTENLNAVIFVLTLISVVSFIYTLIHDVNNDSNAIILFNVFLDISIILIIIAVIYPFRKKITSIFKKRQQNEI